MMGWSVWFKYWCWSLSMAGLERPIILFRRDLSSDSKGLLVFLIGSLGSAFCS
jgi:hypothetical protein